MVHVEYGGTFSPLMKNLAKGFADIRPLAKEIGRLMLEGNREIGTDWNSNNLAPLAPSTLKRRDGTGPPLAPHGLDSRIVTNAQINVVGIGDYVAIELSWKDMPWLTYHSTGTKYMKQRDITGIRPETMDQIGDLIQSFFDDLVDFRQGYK
jgi:hypothetical protein